MVLLFYFINVTTASKSLFHCHHPDCVVTWIQNTTETKWTIVQIESNIRLGFFKPVQIIRCGTKQNTSWIRTFLFWKSLLTSKILAVILCIFVIEMLILNEYACATGLQYWSKPIPWIWELTFEKWSTKIYMHQNSHIPWYLEQWYNWGPLFHQGDIW